MQAIALATNREKKTQMILFRIIIGAQLSHLMSIIFLMSLNPTAVDNNIHQIHPDTASNLQSGARYEAPQLPVDAATRALPVVV